MKNSVFCKSYNVSTPFQNLQKRSLALCRKCGILQTRYPQWSMVRFSLL